MSSTTAISGISTTAQDAANTAARTKKQTLDQEDFLKLITVQLTKQDPMKPMEDTAFIAQMAQFSALEQSNQLVREMGYLRADAQLQAANSMLGREVTIATSSGNVTGVVEAIEAESDAVYVNVAGQKYAFGSVTHVRPAPVATP